MDSSLDNFKRAPYHSKKHSSYFAAYDLLLKPYRNKPITFLEIGVLNGGSLFMWKSFLGEHARIVGIDLNPAATKWEEYGFEIYIGSQSDSSFWLEILAGIGPIDVIVDDGGHTFRQQILTCEAVLPSVRNGGCHNHRGHPFVLYDRFRRAIVKVIRFICKEYCGWGELSFRKVAKEPPPQRNFLCIVFRIDCGISYRSDSIT